MSIKKDSVEWNMMRDLYKLYSEYVGITTSPDDQKKFAKLQLDFELKYRKIPMAKRFSEAMSIDYIKKIRE